MHQNILVLVVLTLVAVIPDSMCKSRNITKLKKDAFSRTRCDLMCRDMNPEEKAQCRKRCRQGMVKPGTCPAKDSPTWAQACVEACNKDSQCDGTHRCCQLGCGTACSEPTDLLTLSGLPPRPVLGEPQEKGHSTIVQWSGGVGDDARSVPGRVLYLLEEQHLLGPEYEEARLGNWNLLLRTKKTKVSLRNLLKPGRWYRFRVAAVSDGGTRGFSQPSPAFTPRKGPRPPPPPRDIKVRRLSSDNGTLSVLLEWREPRSDLPVLGYKVFWSRRVRGVGAELDSVLVNDQTVSEKKNHLTIKGLQPNSMYFFQVQTISKFGLGKLRSDKSEIFYNTTYETNNTQYETRNDYLRQALKKENETSPIVTGLKFNTFVWNKHSLSARVSWEPIGKSRKKPKYYIHWEAIGCVNNRTRSTDVLSAVTRKTTFDIYEIDYDCRYKVIVKSAASQSTDSGIVIKVPNCSYIEKYLIKIPDALKCAP